MQQKSAIKNSERKRESREVRIEKLEELQSFSNMEKSVFKWTMWLVQIIDNDGEKDRKMIGECACLEMCPCVCVCVCTSELRNVEMNTNEEMRVLEM